MLKTKTRTKTKTICLWCGKSHKGRRPKKCSELSERMSLACKKYPAFAVMRCLELFGSDALASGMILRNCLNRVFPGKY